MNRMPIQRMWRDMRAANSHGGNIPENIYQNWGLATFGHPVIPGIY